MDLEHCGTVALSHYTPSTRPSISFTVYVLHGVLMGIRFGRLGCVIGGRSRDEKWVTKRDMSGDSRLAKWSNIGYHSTLKKWSKVLPNRLLNRLPYSGIPKLLNCETTKLRNSVIMYFLSSLNIIIKNWCNIYYQIGYQLCY